MNALVAGPTWLHGWTVLWYPAVQTQKAVSAYFTSKQILPFDIARQYGLLKGWRSRTLGGRRHNLVSPGRSATSPAVLSWSEEGSQAISVDHIGDYTLDKGEHAIHYLLTRHPPPFVIHCQPTWLDLSSLLIVIASRRLYIIAITNC